MHRTGSSLVARIFHEFGVYMGDNLGGFDPANEEGEYENLEITALNNSLLSENGGSWLDPKEVDCVDDRTFQLVGKYMKEFSLWGWKDNRTAFTFPTWRNALTVAQQNIMFVITHREKEAVIDSLMRTHKMQFPEEKRNREYMGELYDRYYKQIDEVTTGYNRIDIHYEDLKTNKWYNPKLRHF